jgi:hypothetical protein
MHTEGTKCIPGADINVRADDDINLYIAFMYET